MDLKNNYIKKILLYSFVIFIFFFDFLKNYTDLRLIIFIPFFFALYINYSSVKKIDKNFLYIFAILILLLTLQGQYLLNNLSDRIYNIKSIIFFIVSVYGIWSFSDFLLKKIDFIFKIFLIFFFTYTIFFLILNIDLIFGKNNCYIGCFSYIDSDFKFYTENSHVGFLSTSIIAYLVLKIKKIDYFFISSIIFYLFVSHNFSLTTFIPLFFILLYFLIVYFKKFNLYQKILLIVFITSSIFTISSTTEALDKLKNIYNFDNWKVVAPQTKNDVNFQSKKENVKNLSTEVFIVSLNISKLAFFEKPLGYGFNNYHVAFNKHIGKINITNPVTKKLNIFDASNNFSKIITEFGIFSLVIFFILFKFLFSSKIAFEYKFIIFPSLFTQTFIRGAGYFNGGYILFLILVFYLIFNKNNQKI